MKIGIDASSFFGWRGPSRNIKNLVRSLQDVDRGNRYYLFAPQAVPDDFALSSNFTWVHVKKRRYVSWLNISLPLAVMKHKLDLFVFPQNSFWVWKLLKTVVFFRATVIAPFYDNILDKIESSIRVRRLKHVADRIVFSSNTAATLGKLIYGLDGKRCSVIFNAVDPGFKECKKDAKPESFKYLLYVGGTEANKNVDRLIAAYRLIKNERQFSDLKLVMVGGKYGRYGMDRDQFNQRHSELIDQNSIIIKGVIKNMDDLAALYSHAEALIFPSLIETFGIVPLEAMACGCPVVASCAPAIPEVLGDSAIFFNPYEAGDIARKIMTVLNDQAVCDQLVKKGHEQVRQYSWEKSARQLLQVINELAR